MDDHDVELGFNSAMVDDLAAGGTVRVKVPLRDDSGLRNDALLDVDHCEAEPTADVIG
jgi:hypothetical protein